VKIQTKKLHSVIRGFSKLPHFAVVSVVVAASLISVAVAATCTSISDCQSQISNLNQQNSSTRGALSGLTAQARTYQDAINVLQGQINVLSAQIAANEARQADLQNQIVQKQAEIDYNRHILAEDIRTMYVDGQMSTIEQLATSKNLSEYVDKEEYRQQVQNKITTIMAQITKLQQQLKEQKLEVERLLVDQRAQQAEISAARAEQSRLLSMNQSQQAAFNSQLKSNSAKIRQLQQQQEDIIVASQRSGTTIRGGACDRAHGDTYPSYWCSIAQDSVVDSWGMYNRECVSYTAWKVHESGRFMPYWGGRGNANRWDDNAKAAGIPVDYSPRRGDVAIKNSGTYGHAMYVESVNDDGSINISQYNANSITNPGKFSRVYGLSTSGLVFIHFPY
jgi:peptidoglycan DL-endopeptidase CwlO